MQLSYETDFKSKREDGRFFSSMAAYMEMLRNSEPKLAMPDNITVEAFDIWRNQLKQKVIELLSIPEIISQPEAKCINHIQREGYAVERWELYPDGYTVLPILVLIPDGICAENQAPGVMCLPGSVFSKEFLAGEPLPEGYFEKYPERNRMALYMVQNGMVAFAFDHPEVAECGINGARESLCYGYIQGGLNYAGVSVFQKLCALEFIKKLAYVDQNKLAVCAHSLGTMPAAYLGLICDEIKAVVFNDMVSDHRRAYMAITEEDNTKMAQHAGDWHLLPGKWKWYSNPDILAALAPKYLALNEGGAEEFINKIKKAYDLLNAPDRLQISQYPKYRDSKSRTHSEPLPKYGISIDEYYEHCYVDAPDHSFRKEPSIKLLKKAFNLS